MAAHAHTLQDLDQIRPAESLLRCYRVMPEKLRFGGGIVGPGLRSKSDFIGAFTQKVSYDAILPISVNLKTVKFRLLSPGVGRTR